MPSEVIAGEARMQKEDRELLKTKYRLNKTKYRLNKTKYRLNKTKCRFVFRKFDPQKIVAERGKNNLLLAPSQKKKNTEHLPHRARSI